MQKIDKKFFPVFIMAILFAFSVAIPTYVSSTFLTGFVSEKVVGMFYTISSVMTIFLLVWMPTLLKKIGNYKATLYSLFAITIALLFVAFSSSTAIVSIAFIVNLILINTIVFSMDVFLENISEDENTGHIRGHYLAITNFGWLLSPMLAGLILKDHDYWKIFAIAAAITIPIILITIFKFRNFKDPAYEQLSILKTLGELRKRKNVFLALISQFSLRFFYSWMVIYTPIYLYEYMKFEWNTIGIIFTIMLLPFVLLEIPIGKIEDDKLGEKEILNAGFIVMAVATAVIAYTTSTNPIIWGIILFMTRVGASMVEVSSESYFFKKVDSSNTNVISLFRIMRPVAYAISPVVASATLFVTDFKNLFVILGVIVLLTGLLPGLFIKDTK